MGWFGRKKKDEQKISDKLDPKPDSLEVGGGQ